MVDTRIVLRIAASVPFMAGLIGIVTFVLTVVWPSRGVQLLNAFEGNILWFGGVQPYSFADFRLFAPLAADLFTVQYPLFALGPHLCGAGGFLYIADGVIAKRTWALFVLFCVITIAGLNDSCGAYIHFLKTGEKGFIVPMVATTLGTLGLLLFVDSIFKPGNSYIVVDKSRFSGKVYSFARKLSLLSTGTVMVLWIFLYLSFFLPGYLFHPEKDSSFFGRDVPSLYDQLQLPLLEEEGIPNPNPNLGINDPMRATHLRSTHIYGFSVMTAQMCWAAGAVGFGISPFVCSFFGLLDSSASLRSGCILFLGYVSFCSLFFVHLTAAISPVSAPTVLSEAVIEPIRAALFFYGVVLGTATLLLGFGHNRGLVSSGDGKQEEEHNKEE
jgi:hypothetical protein